MSDLISAWVDRDEMRRLADSLLSRPPLPELEQSDFGLGNQFEGFSDGTPISASPVGQVAVSTGATPSPLEQASPNKNEAAVTPESVDAISSSESPSMVRSAVQFLKKAQSEGKAGGVIRSPKATPSTSVPPSEVEAVVVSTSPKPEPRPIHSPFRRVDKGVEPAQLTQAEAAAIQPTVGEPQPTRKIARPPAQSGDEPILARVTRFGKWLKGPVKVREFFISNIEGKILIDEVGNPKLIQVARSLATASNSESGEVANLHVRIGEHAILEVVPTPSQFGTLILGLIVEHSLSEDLIREIRLGLEEVANARLLRG